MIPSITRHPQQLPFSLGGLLIIWDRMFGTFAAEKERVYYGLLHQPKTWNPLWAQFFYVIHVVKRVWAHKGITEKLRFLFCSPGWTPGYGRMGFRFTEPYPKVRFVVSMGLQRVCLRGSFCLNVVAASGNHVVHVGACKSKLVSKLRWEGVPILWWYIVKVMVGI